MTDGGFKARTVVMPNGDRITSAYLPGHGIEDLTDEEFAQRFYDALEKARPYDADEDDAVQ
jgi:hypothetical protein